VSAAFMPMMVSDQIPQGHLRIRLLTLALPLFAVFWFWAGLAWLDIDGLDIIRV
jgi:hypothetical protein